MAINIMRPVLTLEQKAKLKKLNGMLSIKDIALLRYKDDEDLIKHYAYDIAEACLTGELDFIHGVMAHDLRWLYDHQEAETILELPIDYETSPMSESEAYNDINSAWCLVSEWTGVPHPKPAYKYNDNSAKLKRLYANNHDSAAYDFYRFDYAMGGRCLIAHNVFKNWLISTGNFPLPENCLLNNWFESVENNDNYLTKHLPYTDDQTKPDLTKDEMRDKIAEAWKEQNNPTNLNDPTNNKTLGEIISFFRTYQKEHPEYPSNLFEIGGKYWFSHKRDKTIIPPKKSGNKINKKKHGK